MGGGLKTLGGTVVLTRRVWGQVVVGAMVVSGCSSFACGLDRLMGRLKTRIAMLHGSTFRLRRLRGFSGVVLSPNPNVPSRTNLLLRMVGECTNGGPVLNMYLKRRTVKRTFNNGLAGLDRMFRNMRAPVSVGGGRSGSGKGGASCVFGKLPSRIPMKHCRS